MKITDPHPTFLPVDNIDTDRIIPARFLTTTRRDGLGCHLFEDWPEGKAALSDASILIAGNNFGCGSSREHAVWALVDRGFRAIVSTGFADIFHANAIRNGLAPVVIAGEDHARLVSLLDDGPDHETVLDFTSRRLICGPLDITFSARAVPTGQAIPGDAELDLLLARIDDIERWEAHHPPRIDTRKDRR